MAEKSGIDMIKELLLEVKLLRSEIKVLDQKVAHIANSTKIAELMTKAVGTNLDAHARSKPKAVVASPTPKESKTTANFKFERSDDIKNKSAASNEKSDNKPTLVSGKMITQIDGKNVALIGLNVKIYDSKDKLVKQTKTNNAGCWMSHLPPNNYVANIEGKYKNQDLVPINIKFSVLEGMKELEVG